MAETLHRVLRLLSLLEARASWSGPELAERLGVTERTVRRDVERLRSLGYPVEGERGADGGYRLGAGRRLPPLLLDDDEAVALVACLRMAALGGSDSIGEAALRALAKLDHVLPPHLRALATALDEATVVLPSSSRPEVDWQRLSTLARATRESVRVRFEYESKEGGASSRDVEPARLLTQGQLWYLQAFDPSREDWRTFRLDRMSHIHVTTFRFRPRPAPQPAYHPAGIVDRYPCVAVVHYATTPGAVVARVPRAYYEDLHADATGTVLRVGAPDWGELAWHLQWVARDLDASLTVLESDALRAALARLAAEFAGASNRNQVPRSQSSTGPSTTVKSGCASGSSTRGSQSGARPATL